MRFFASVFLFHSCPCWFFKIAFIPFRQKFTNGSRLCFFVLRKKPPKQKCLIICMERKKGIFIGYSSLTVYLGDLGKRSVASKTGTKQLSVLIKCCCLQLLHWFAKTLRNMQPSPKKPLKSIPHAVRHDAGTVSATRKQHRKISILHINFSVLHINWQLKSLCCLFFAVFGWQQPTPGRRPNDMHRRQSFTSFPTENLLLPALSWRRFDLPTTLPWPRHCAISASMCCSVYFVTALFCTC